MRLHQCPRCAWECFEKLRTHSYCINCNYYEVQAASVSRPAYMTKLSKPGKPIELTVIDNDRLITDFAHEAFPNKITAQSGRGK